VSADQASLPPGWALTTLSEVGSIRLGRQRSPDKHSGRYPTKYLRAANIAQNGLNLSDVLEMDFTPSERALFGLRTGDLVLTEASGSAAHVGRAAVWRGEIPGCCFQNTVIRFRPHAIDSQFALTWFEHASLSGIFGRLARGVGILHLGASRLASLQVELPPLPEQIRIAAEVDRRRAEIRQAQAALREAQEKVLEQKREILAQAVTGELVPTDKPEAEPTGQAGTSLMGKWRWTTVDHAGAVDLGKKREPSSHSGPYMRPYLRVANVLEDYIDTTDVKEMNFPPGEFEKFQLRVGDILLNEGQSPELVGRPAMYRGEPVDTCFQMTLLRFRAHPDVDPEFALIVFRHYLHSGEFRKVSQGSTNIVHLSRKRLLAMRFPIPPREQQLAIVASVKRRMEDLKLQESFIGSSLARLPDLMQELLSAAVRGDLVPQDPDDEPAPNLLDRLGKPTEDTLAAGPETSSEEVRVPEESARDFSTEDPSTIVQALRGAGHPVSLPDLFTHSGYNRDSVTDVESFYLDLRDSYGTVVVAADDRPENASLRMADDAP
jgi:type I restriction enzyme S subunit